MECIEKQLLSGAAGTKGNLAQNNKQQTNGQNGQKHTHRRKVIAMIVKPNQENVAIYGNESPMSE